ncbi:MAG TPA: lipocalin-like domain-containing protein [Dongiaceae bacterium]|nr:lipocalin-like domain-containing protein [Dongiaceae bacterium]
MRSSRKSILAAYVAALLVVQPVFAQFKNAVPGYRFEFPRDYFSHPDFQTEWWYYTGNVRAADGHEFGFELTFFRHAVAPEPSGKTPWAVRDIYLAHFAVSDLSSAKFLYQERTNRAGPGLAGADDTRRRVWNGNWSIEWREDSEQLSAVADNFALNLVLRSRKPPVIHGENGVSQKSAEPGRASHYFSETRLAADGSIRIAARSYPVNGLAWMDHEFFTQQLAPGQSGWDWLSLQLDDNTELMLFRIRRKDGSLDAFSAGTLVDAQGRARHLAAQDFQFVPVAQDARDTYRSDRTGAVYPLRWTVRIPSLQLALTVSTPLAAQELAGDSASTRITPSYWEGAVRCEGTRDARAIRGSGYLELTGYDRPVEMR